MKKTLIAILAQSSFACIRMCGPRASLAVACTLASVITLAQTDQRTLEFAGYRWSVAARTAEIVNHLGIESLRLEAGRIIANDINFMNGVIQFDAAFTEQQSFIGAGWRLEDSQNFEEMYFRAHLNNEPDTLQYTPVYNGISAWQMFYDEFSIAPITHRYETWNHVKIVVDGNSAEIFYNDNDDPALHIRELDRDPVSGAINLRVSGQGAEPVYFSNFSVTPLGSGDRIMAAPAAEISVPDGLIRNWQVSAPFSETVVQDAITLSERNSGATRWQTLAVNDKGFTNLAELHTVTQENDTVLIRATINADSSGFREMRFGFSDRARIYLNGDRIYTGIGGWRVRNYSYMGLLSFHDAIGLNLQAGDNELLIAVSETFGGWSWGAAIADRDGLSIRD